MNKKIMYGMLGVLLVALGLILLNQMKLLPPGGKPAKPVATQGAAASPGGETFPVKKEIVQVPIAAAPAPAEASAAKAAEPGPAPEAQPAPGKGAEQAPPAVQANEAQLGPTKPAKEQTPSPTPAEAASPGKAPAKGQAKEAVKDAVKEAVKEPPAEAPPLPKGGKNTIKDVVVQPKDKGVVVRIITLAPVEKFKQYILKSPQRVVVDLSGEWRHGKEPATFPDNPIFKQIRFGQHEGLLRLVIDLKSESRLRVDVTKEPPAELILTMEQR